MVEALFAATVLAVSPVRVWTVTFGGIKADELVCVAEDDLGRVLAGGSTASYSTGDLDGWVVCLEPDDGEVVWERPYGGTGEDAITDIIPVRDGSCYLIGHTSSMGNGESDLWVVKIDREGKTLWEQTYGGEFKDAASSGALLPDSSVVAAGNTWSEGAGGSDAWLVNIGPDGEVQWARTFGGNRMERAFDVSCVGERLIFVGTTYSEGSCGEVLVVWTDLWGMEKHRLVWGRSGYDIGKSVAVDDSGTAHVACWSKSTDCDAVLISVDSTGSLVREHLFPMGSDTRLEAIADMGQGNLAIAGYTETRQAADTDVFVWGINPDCSIGWSNVAGVVGNDAFYDVVLCSGGRLVVVGSTTAAERADTNGWVIALGGL